MPPIYIFGHKNPDTDSVCSAIAYARLKNQEQAVHIPARLGELNQETAFVLRHFDVPSPLFLEDIYTRVQDVMTADPITAPDSSTILEAGELMHDHGIRTMPIVDRAGRAVGLVTEAALARNYLREMQVQGLRQTPTSLDKIAQTLDGRLLVGDPAVEVRGNVLIGAMSPDAMKGYIRPGDLVAVGNRENAQEAALHSQIAALIVTGDFQPSPNILNLARQLGAAVILTPHDTFGAARLINLSASVVHTLDGDMLTVTPDTLVNEIQEDLPAARGRIALVNDVEGRLIGVVSPTDLVRHHRQQVILVDHSERSQTVDGIEQAEILEILDHHRLGSLQTAEPVVAVIAPVGCTATLVLRRYREMGVDPSQQTAGLLLSAILSDTMLLKSPTTTAEDVRAVEALGAILGIDPLAYGKRMYDAKFELEALSPKELVTNDFKEFVLGSLDLGIGQVEVADRQGLLARKQEILEAMRTVQEARGYDLLLLMVSDILDEGTELLAVGQTRLLEKAFDVSLTEHAVWLPGVLSRKKQVVPPLAQAA